MAADSLTIFVVLGTLAFGPSLIYLRWFRNLERYEREPLAKVLRAFIWGAVGAIIWVTIINILLVDNLGGYLETQYDVVSVSQEGLVGFLILAVILAPLLEEAVKVWGVSSRARVKDQINEVEDAMIYGAAIGLGFAATENLFYGFFAWADTGAGAGVATLVVRALSSTLLHTSATALAGYGVGRVLVAGDPGRVRLGYYLLAVGLHATFNGTAVVGEALGGEWGGLLAFFFVIGLAWYATDFVRRRIHELDARSLPAGHQGRGPGAGVGGAAPYGPPAPRAPPPSAPAPRPAPPPPSPPAQGYGQTVRATPPGGQPAVAGPPPLPRARAAAGQQQRIIELEIRGPGGRSSRVRVPTTLTLAKLVESSRSHFKLPPRRYRLLAGDEPLHPQRTVAQAGLKPREVIRLEVG